MNEKRVVVTSLLLTLISLFGKIIGFIRETLLAGYFGTSYVVDAYLMSISIPSILFGWLPAIGVGYVPQFFEVHKNERDRFTSNVLCWTALLALGAITFVLIFNDQIVRLVAPGYFEERFDLTVLYLKITIWGVLFITPIQILISYLNCKERFVQSSISTLFLSLIQGTGIVLGAKFNLLMLPMGVLLAYIIQFIFLFVSCKFCEFKFTGSINLDHNIKSLLTIVIPIFISNSLVDINSFVDQFLASTLETGSVSGLSYAFNLKSFFYLVFTTAITTIMYPKISSMIAEGKEREVSGYIENIIIIIIIIFLPLTVGALIMAEPLIKCVYMRGAFDKQSLAYTLGPFIMYIMALPFLALRDICIKILYAYKNSRVNLIGGGIAIAINILLSMILVKRMGVSGLALATSISCILSLPFYVFILSKKNMSIRIINIFRWSVVSIISSSVMAFMISKLANCYLNEVEKIDMGYYVSTILIIIVGVFIYFFFLLLFNFSTILRYLKNIVNKRGDI